MIELSSLTAFSKLLFLNDLYRTILDVQGDVLHIGAPTDAPPTTLWSWLRDTYERRDARRLSVILTDSDLTEGTIHDRLLSYFDVRSPIIALAYFDDCDVQETTDCLNLVIPYLTRGSVIAFSMLHDHATPIRDIIGFGSIGLQRWHACRKDCYAVI